MNLEATRLAAWKSPVSTHVLLVLQQAIRNGLPAQAVHPKGDTVAGREGRFASLGRALSTCMRPECNRACRLVGTQRHRGGWDQGL